MVFAANVGKQLEKKVRGESKKIRVLALIYDVVFFIYIGKRVKILMCGYPHSSPTLHVDFHLKHPLALRVGGLHAYPLAR